MRQVADRYTQVIIHTKTTSADPDPCVRWIYPSDYPYKDNILWSWPRHQVAGGYTQVIICTKITSDNPDPCVRWQADIPNWLFVQRPHLMILIQASGGKRIYNNDYPYKDNIYWSGPRHQDQCARWQADIPKWLSIQRQYLMILTHASGGRRIYPCYYPYQDNIWWSWPMRQVASGYTQVIIHTWTTSHDPNPCIRWQADIPKWLSVQRQHLLILTHASGGRRIYPSDYPYKHNICWSWPMRQVVGGCT